MDSATSALSSEADIRAGLQDICFVHHGATGAVKRKSRRDNPGGPRSFASFSSRFSFRRSTVPISAKALRGLPSPAAHSIRAKAVARLDTRLLDAGLGPMGALALVTLWLVYGCGKPARTTFAHDRIPATIAGQFTFYKLALGAERATSRGDRQWSRFSLRFPQ
jgi:hypothetical protein